MKSELLFTDDQWTNETLQKTWDVIDEIGREELGLDYYQPQIQLVTFDQMLEAYTNIGLPVNYTHWSFGKSFITNDESYRKGQMGLAYELVINSNPAIAYCLETNTSTMQALVLAHACCGHVHFFKNNYLFKEWTNADSIIEYMKFAKNYVDSCYDRFGHEIVEDFLDSCHALQSYGVDIYKRGSKKDSFEKELTRAKHLEEMARDTDGIYPGFSGMEKIRNHLRTQRDLHQDERALLQANKDEFETYRRGLPEENLLYFFEKESPYLLEWQRELIRIVRNIATYFYPQRQTKVMNEGFASAIHYTIMTMLEERGHITEGNMLEFLHSHTNVCCQRAFNPLNPYTLGFSIFMDIKRICLDPTKEDKEWFPLIAGTKDWLSIWKDAVENYRDESFISQFLSPKVIRDLKLFNLHTGEYDKDNYLVDQTHREKDYLKIRATLADQYSLEYHRPNIQIARYSRMEQSIDLQLVSSSKHRKIPMEIIKEMRHHIEMLWTTDKITYRL